MFRVMLFVLLFLNFNFCLANSKDSTINEKSKTDGFIPLPLIVYTPETKFALIFAGLYYKHFNLKDTNARPLELNGYLLYSQKEQFIVQFGLINFFKNNQFLLKADGMYDIYVDNYWGIGTNAKEENKEEFSFIQYRFRAGFLYQLLPRLYAGLSYHYYNYNITELKSDGELLNKQLLGFDGATISGPGIQIFTDKTNSAFFPTKGYNFDFKYNVFSKDFSSTSNSWRSEFDFRYFYELLEDNVLAFNTVLMFSGGDIPFMKLPLLGGSQINRGFVEGRFRDKLLYGAQVEYRFPIYWRFAGTVFSGIGDVSPNLSSFQLLNMKNTYGLGIRFIADTKEHIAIRLDIANSSQGINFYLNIKEAF